MKRFGKLITLVLVVAMALSLMSVAALAADSSDYKDVVAGKWYVQYVDWALENEFMTGISDTEWAPNTATTRGMVIQTLYKMAGAPEVEGDSPFADVAEGKYYTNAVKWAVKAGVASGKSTDSFKPDDVLTRQEAATFFCAFAKNVWELDVTDVSGMNKFPDNADVANYAKDAMGWAVKANVISGSKENDKVLLMPKRDITRAELAAMLKALEKLKPDDGGKDDPAPAPEYETADVVVTVTSDDKDENLNNKMIHIRGTDKNGNPVGSDKLTNKEGKVTFKNVVVSGDEPYVIWESNFDSDKYFVDGYDEYNQMEVSVVGPTTEVGIHHEFNQEKVTVRLIGEDDAVTLEGVKVQLSGKSATGAEVSKMTTANRDGIAKFNVPASDDAGYKVEVVELDSYYIAPNAKTVKVANTHTAKTEENKVGVPYEVVMKIALQRSQVKVVLVDEKGNPLDTFKDVKISMTGKRANGFKEKTSEITVAGGVAVFKDLPYSDAAGYTAAIVTDSNKALLKDYEYEAVSGIVADKADLGVVTIVLKKIQKGAIELTKVDPDGNAVEGAVFTLTLNGKTVKDDIKTDENGYAKIGNLEAAKKEAYVLTETEAPTGYVVADPVKVGEVKDKTVTSVKVVDEFATAKVEVMFKDINTQEPIAGPIAHLKGAPAYGYEDDNYTHVGFKSSQAADGKGKDPKGYANFNDDPVVLSAPNGYVLSVTNIPAGYKVYKAPARVVVDGDKSVTVWLGPTTATVNVKVVEKDNPSHVFSNIPVNVKGKTLSEGTAVNETKSPNEDKVVEFVLEAADKDGYTFTAISDDYDVVKVQKVTTADIDKVDLAHEPDGDDAESDDVIEVVIEVVLKGSRTQENQPAAS